jgi:hypothetical protein
MGDRIQLQRSFSRTALALLLAWGGLAQAALIDRGSGMIYDSDLDITWMQDAGGTRLPQFTQADARAAAGALNINGIGGWRLPSMDVNGDGVVVDCAASSVSVQSCKDNEFGFLFQYELAGAVVQTGPSTGTARIGNVVFLNISIGAGGNSGYWSDTNDVFGQDPRDAWWYEPGNRAQGVDFADEWRHWWAVRAGDVAEPATVALIGIALLCGLGASRRRAP